MPAKYDIEPYDPCPCGSGKKYKFCCAEKARANRHGKYPIGTVAYYGPDDKTVTKITACVFLRETADPILQRWFGNDVATDPKVAEEIKQFFARHGVKNVGDVGRIIGCPHEQPDDFPDGQECPFCPFWAGKQGIVLDDENDEEFEDDAEDWDDDEEAADDETDLDEESESDDAATEEAEDEIDRVQAIIGDPEARRDKALERILAHLRANLQLPCEVTGCEDFRWEEPYVIGGWSPSEYRKLKKTQPSYRDRYQLLSISNDEFSEWMLFQDEDLCAHCRRISDGKEFVLGLAELKATDKKSNNYQLINDYAVWFVNTR